MSMSGALAERPLGRRTDCARERLDLVDCGRTASGVIVAQADNDRAGDSTFYQMSTSPK